MTHTYDFVLLKASCFLILIIQYMCKCQVISYIIHYADPTWTWLPKSGTRQLSYLPENSTHLQIQLKKNSFILGHFYFRGDTHWFAMFFQVIMKTFVHSLSPRYSYFMKFTIQGCIYLQNINLPLFSPKLSFLFVNKIMITCVVFCILALADQRQTL